MRRRINKTQFGSITIDDTQYEHDVIIRGNGAIQKRKKRLSKAIYGTSHTISLEEAKHLYEKNCDTLIVGSGQYGNVKLSKEAQEFFEKKQCKVILLPTPKAIKTYNKFDGDVAAMFHVTC